MTTTTKTPAELAASLTPRDLNAVLAPSGWCMTEVTINQVTGFCRVKAERRDHGAGAGVLVTLHRSAHGARVTETREVTERRPGMFRDHWEVVDGGVLGRRRCEGMRSALRMLANYIDDNGASGALVGRRALRQLGGAV